MFCSNCGAELNTSASFCANCGAKVVFAAEKKPENDSLFGATETPVNEPAVSKEESAPAAASEGAVYEKPFEAPVYEAQPAPTYYCTPMNENGVPVKREEVKRPIFGIIALICAILGGMVPAIPLAIIGLKMDKTSGNRARCILAIVIFALWILMGLVSGFVLGFLDASGYDFGAFQPLVDLLLEM